MGTELASGHMITYFIIDASVLLENTPLVQFTRNYIRDTSGLFSISSLVKISMVSDIVLATRT